MFVLHENLQLSLQLAARARSPPLRRSPARGSTCTGSHLIRLGRRGLPRTIRLVVFDKNTKKFYNIDRGAQNLTRENLKVVLAEFSTLS